MLVDPHKLALQCIQAADPLEKCQLSEQAVAQINAGELLLTSEDDAIEIENPGRPETPNLVAPKKLPKRKLGTVHGRAALIHALAHIEFNAINLAWDAVYRFRGLPEQYYRDWARVASEEAVHFGLLSDRLNKLDLSYGDLEAHNGLWEMACKTAHDPLVRMALVPRVLEARGLDVTPGMIERLQKEGDQESVEVLEIILRDEIVHVQIGTRWFNYLCKQRELDSSQTFIELLREYMSGQVRGPFHYEARAQAGFSAQEMRDLDQMSEGGR